jgi:hypothetical protein
LKNFSLPPDFAGFFLGLLFTPEDGGDIFLRNVGFSPNYMATAVRTSNPAIICYFRSFPQLFVNPICIVLPVDTRNLFLTASVIRVVMTDIAHLNFCES